VVVIKKIKSRKAISAIDDVGTLLATFCCLSKFMAVF
jgi:EAL domain-containing protein (putative c-di-GMP-specific phosphodiesterase class I)